MSIVDKVVAHLKDAKVSHSASGHKTYERQVREAFSSSFLPLRVHDSHGQDCVRLIRIQWKKDSLRALWCALHTFPALCSMAEEHVSYFATRRAATRVCFIITPFVC